MSRLALSVRAIVVVVSLTLAPLAIGCSGYSYVYRSPLERPLEGVGRVGVRLEAQTTGGDAALARTFTSHEDALVAWLTSEERAVSFGAISGGEEATITISLALDPRIDSPDPFEVRYGSVRIAVTITIERGSERVAVVEGTASTPLVAFHGLLDPDHPRVLERLAHRISRVLEDLGVPRR